ncbi:hypothetical protein GCK32_006364 [Trichostrongylus colubriformis]|uniref:Uncharacterized protein n=1 Tax=Trichostrongylus colubriformis TaxID=6319 RepID=A0AAN8F4A0_TRICO
MTRETTDRSQWISISKYHTVPSENATGLSKRYELSHQSEKNFGLHVKILERGNISRSRPSTTLTYDHHPWLSHRTQGEHLSAIDIHVAQYMLIKNHQMVHIDNQYEEIMTENLNMRRRETKSLRTYGKLNKSNLSVASKNPIFINTDLCHLIIDGIHGPSHKGTTHTVSDIRQIYGIPRIREHVKNYHDSAYLVKNEQLAYKYPDAASATERDMITYRAHAVVICYRENEPRPAFDDSSNPGEPPRNTGPRPPPIRERLSSTATECEATDECVAYPFRIL